MPKVLASDKEEKALELTLNEYEAMNGLIVAKRVTARN